MSHLRPLLAGVLLLVVACGSSPADRADGEHPVTIAVAFYPLAWLAERLGGDAVEVTTLTPDGVEPHDLQVSADALEAMEAADVVLYLSRDFQPDVERAVAHLDAVQTADLIGDDAGVRLIAAADDLGKAPLAGGEDPHVWLDPVRFAEMAEEAAAAMVESRPELAEEVDVNLARVRSDLATLDGELDLALFDCERDTIVTSHAAFGYFADRYGLRQLAIAGLSPDAEPDARTLEEIAATAESRGVTTVFFEEALPPDLSQTVAEEIGADIALLGALEFSPESAIGQGEDYLSVMRANGAAIAEGLSCH